MILTLAVFLMLLTFACGASNEAELKFQVAKDGLTIVTAM